MEAHTPDILVVFAVPEEARPFRRRLGKRSGIRVLVTGMGSDNTERVFEAALAERQPLGVLTCGFTGALNPQLDLGSVVFDADAGFPWTERLLARGARPARFEHVDQVLTSAATKAAVRRSSGADAVDMESAVIRTQCMALGIPAATVRVVSDIASRDLPLDFNHFLTPSRRIHYVRLIGHILIHPGIIPGLLQFRRETRLAANRLARVLAGLFSELPNPPAQA